MTGDLIVCPCNTWSDFARRVVELQREERSRAGHDPGDEG